MSNNNKGMFEDLKAKKFKNACTPKQNVEIIWEMKNGSLKKGRMYN
jgi:hypothetical protein